MEKMRSSFFDIWPTHDAKMTGGRTPSSTTSFRQARGRGGQKLRKRSPRGRGLAYRLGVRQDGCRPGRGRWRGARVTMSRPVQQHHTTAVAVTAQEQHCSSSTTAAQPPPKEGRKEGRK